MKNLCECLIGLVGLRDICEDPETCVRYLNDLPGISNEAFALMREIDFDDSVKVFERIEKNGIHKLYYDVFGKAKFKKAKKDKSYTTGKFSSPSIQIGNEDFLRGWLINLYESDYLEAIIQRFRIFSTTAADFNLYVYDADSCELIDTIPFTSDGSGKQSFGVSGRCYGSCDSVFIAYNANEIDSIQTEEKGRYGHRCYGTCNICGCGPDSFYRFPLGGQDPSDIEVCYDGLQRDHRRGLILEYKRSCSYSRWLCECKEELSEPLLYAMGIQFFNEIPGILGKLNKLTLLPNEVKDSITENLEKEYDSALEIFMQGALTDCCCFKCNPIVSKVGTLP